MSEASSVRESANARTAAIRSSLLWIIVSVWFGAVIGLAGRGAFEVSGDALPIMIIVAATAPPILFLLTYRASGRLRAWVGGLDLAAITAAQSWRVVGAVFLFLWGLGSLPAVFALPAGLGDIAVGIAAAFVAIAVARRAANWRKHSYALIVAGLLDFVVAFATAVLSGSGRPLAIADAPAADLLEQLPMVLIPAFAVPVFIILHLIAWLKLRAEP